MRKLVTIFSLIAGFLLVGVSGAVASVSHDHHTEISASPFNSHSTKTINPHCPLEKRHHKGHICPQNHTRDNNKETRIMADCGGNPNGAIPAPLGFSKSHILFSVNSLLPELRDAGNIFVSSNLFQPLISDRIDHPPRS